MVSFGVSPIWTLHLKFEKKYTSKLESQPLRLSYIPTLNVITYAVYLQCNTPRDKIKWFQLQFYSILHTRCFVVVCQCIYIYDQVHVQ